LLQHCNRSGTLVMKPETGYSIRSKL
jgi:hypothetical protein